MKFAEINLLHLKPNIKNKFGINGGFDSRLNVSILAKLCKNIKSSLNAIPGSE